MTFRPYNLLSASSVSDARTNNTGIAFTKGSPVRINASGTLDFVDVSIEGEVINVAGVAREVIPDGTSGQIVTSGKIADISTAASLGDLMYISKTGLLTNIQPSIGVGGFVAGDFVVQVGVVSKNEDNGSLKDLIVSLDIVGQL